MLIFQPSTGCKVFSFKFLCQTDLALRSVVFERSMRNIDRELRNFEAQAVVHSKKETCRHMWYQKLNYLSIPTERICVDIHGISLLLLFLAGPFERQL